jgi:hypothetical protein
VRYHIVASYHKAIDIIPSLGRFDISVQPRSTDGKPIENVVLTLPMPKSSTSVNATCNVGQYMYDPVNKVCEDNG